MRFQVDDIRGSGEQVVGVGRFRARGRGSGADLDVPLGVVGIVRSEKIVHARFFSDPADALRAAGPPD
jgi:ketosteroid isomerase-like protein